MEFWNFKNRISGERQANLEVPKELKIVSGVRIVKKRREKHYVVLSQTPTHPHLAPFRAENRFSLKFQTHGAGEKPRNGIRLGTGPATGGGARAGAGLRKRTSAGWLSLESVRVPCGAGGAGALPRRPAHTLVYFRLRSRGREVACESPGNICWVSCTRGLPQRVTGVCWPVVRLPGPPAVLPPASPGWSGGSGHRLDGGSAGPADRATASTPSGRRHEAPAVLLPRGSGAGLWPRLQAAGHPYG